LDGPLPKLCPAVALSHQDGHHSAVENKEKKVIKIGRKINSPQTTLCLKPFGLLFLSCTSDQQKQKQKHLKEPYNEHSYQVWLHLAQ
jgi:hypothetical protein